MHRQVGDLALDETGVARRGLLVRHLVLPDGLAGTREIMEFLAREISPHTYVNVMGQYRPCGRAAEHPALGNFSPAWNTTEAQRLAREAGLTRLDRRENCSGGCKQRHCVLDMRVGGSTDLAAQVPL